MFNLTTMDREWNKIKSIIEKTQEYESKVIDALDLVNKSKNNACLNMETILSNQLQVYQFVIQSFVTLMNYFWKSANSSYEKLLAQKTNISELESIIIPFSFPLAQEFNQLQVGDLNSSTINAAPQSDTTVTKKSKINQLLEQIWPVFMTSPETIQNEQLINFSDWVKSYIDRFVDILDERIRIQKLLKQNFLYFVNMFENLSKNLSKISKALLNYQIPSLGDLTTKYFTELRNYILQFMSLAQARALYMKKASQKLDNFISQNEENWKILNSNFQQTLKDHMNIRNQLLKQENLFNKINKNSSRVTSKKEEDNNKQLLLMQYQISDLRQKVRTSIKETASNLQELFLCHIEMETKTFELIKSKLIKNQRLQFKDIKKMKLFHQKLEQFIEVFETSDINIFDIVVTDKQMDFLNKEDTQESIEKYRKELVQFNKKFDLKNYNLKAPEKDFFKAALQKQQSQENRVQKNAAEMADGGEQPIKNDDSQDEQQDNKDDNKDEDKANAAEPEEASPRNQNSSQAAILKKKFGMVENEVFLDAFSCGLLDKILLQGKLFITNMKLCFHSYFNKSNLFFGVKSLFTIILFIGNENGHTKIRNTSI